MFLYPSILGLTGKRNTFPVETASGEKMMMKEPLSGYIII